MKPLRTPLACIALAVALVGCAESPDARAPAPNTHNQRDGYGNQRHVYGDDRKAPTPSSMPRTQAAEEIVFTPNDAAPPKIIDPANSIRLVAATDIPGRQRPGDFAPSQWLEIVRPDNGPVRIGRLYASCVCLTLEAPERNVPAGRRALVEARIVSVPPTTEGAYMVFVTVEGKESETVHGTVRIQPQ